jgi:hypothetical protein
MGRLASESPEDLPSFERCLTEVQKSQGLADLVYNAWHVIAVALVGET